MAPEVELETKKPRKKNLSLFQYSCLESSMDRGAWQATVHWVTKSQTQVPPDQAFPLLLSQHLQGPHPQATQAHTLVVLPEGQCSEGS